MVVPVKLPKNGPAPERPAAGIELLPGVRLPEAAVRFQFARSSGPGGQNVNKLNTKAEVWVRPEAIQGLNERALERLRTMAGKRITTAGELHLSAEAERTQEGNRTAVIERLRQMVRQARFEPKPRRKTRPSRASKQRRLDSKHRRSDVKSKRRSGPGEW